MKEKSDSKQNKVLGAGKTNENANVIVPTKRKEVCPICDDLGVMFELTNELGTTTACYDCLADYLLSEGQTAVKVQTWGPKEIAEMEVEGEALNDETNTFKWVVDYVCHYLRSAATRLELSRHDWIDSDGVEHEDRRLSTDEVYARLKTSVCAKLMGECHKWTLDHVIDERRAKFNKTNKSEFDAIREKEAEAVRLYRRFRAGERLSTEELMRLQMAGFL